MYYKLFYLLHINIRFKLQECADTLLTYSVAYPDQLKLKPLKINKTRAGLMVENRMTLKVEHTQRHLFAYEKKLLLCYLNCKKQYNYQLHMSLGRKRI